MCNIFPSKNRVGLLSTNDSYWLKHNRIVLPANTKVVAHLTFIWLPPFCNPTQASTSVLQSVYLYQVVYGSYPHNDSYTAESAASKIGLTENPSRVYEQKSPMDQFQSPNIYCTSLQYCIIIGYTNLVTTENI